MSAAKHTTGPWRVTFSRFSQVLAENGALIATCAKLGSLTTLEANARLIATAPELLAAVESEYIFLADIHNEWPARNTPEGQMKLCRLRDLICKATGRESQDVQDDYGNRNLAKAEVQS